MELNGLQADSEGIFANDEEHECEIQDDRGGEVEVTTGGENR